MRTPSVAMMVIGTIIFVTVCGCWLYAEMHGVGTGALLAFAVPVVGALFLSGGIRDAVSAAEKAANQTNGNLDQRIEAAVSRANAVRDAARTRQEKGDVGPVPVDLSGFNTDKDR